ncbi:MarR family transcriptional regulator [Methylobacterium sp. 10]|uniref:MarR family winged helix-turn-helix transcriptional regulator n=1 Tax=Methylobacterium sp. 10 TaxID=1101191 RepID=UPI0004AE6422
MDDQICFALYAATNAVVRAYRPLLGELGLTYPQYLVMLALWQDGTSSVHVLAERLHLGSNAVTPLVDKLETAGFVTRARGTDRRVVFVALTEAGRRLENDVSDAQQVVACRLGLDGSDLVDLRRELKNLASRLSDPKEVPSVEGR